MAAALYSFTVERGTDLDVPFTWGQQTTPTDPVIPYNVTGYTARMQIRSAVDSNTILATFTTENGGITVDGPGGTFTVSFTNAATSAWTFLDGVYDLEIVSPAGKVRRLVKGGIKVDPDVTR